MKKPLRRVFLGGGTGVRLELVAWLKSNGQGTEAVMDDMVT